MQGLFHSPFSACDHVCLDARRVAVAGHPADSFHSSHIRVIAWRTAGQVRLLKYM